MRTLLRNAARVLTLAGSREARAGAAAANLGELRDASVLMEHDAIKWVGPHADLPASANPEVEVDCTGKTIMPALVDSHTHLVWAGNRLDELEMRLAGEDYQAIFAAGGGILSSVRQTRAADEEDLHAQSLARLRRMMRMGTTSVEIKSGYGLDLATELRQLRVARMLGEVARVRTTCLAAHAIPEEARTSDAARNDFVRRVATEILPAVAREALADYVDVFCDEGAMTVEETRTILDAAQSLGLPSRLHANEFGHSGGAVLAAEYGSKSADHLLHLDDDERAGLRKAGTVATLLPGTSLVLGKPYADGRALISAGVPVAVATDCNPGSCAIESLALALALACYGNRLSPAEAVCAATHNAAASLDLQDEVGRLVPGLSADVLVLDTADYRDLVYHAGSSLLTAIYHRGEPVE